jgi:protein O-GlcNAc transferase
MLDPLHFGGAVTAYDALGVGTPVVTLPGDQPRTRVAGALCELAGVADACVAATADETVARAVRLANDRPWRDDVAGRIREGARRIFDQQSAVAQLEAFLASALEAARDG